MTSNATSFAVHVQDFIKLARSARELIAGHAALQYCCPSDAVLLYAVMQLTCIHLQALKDVYYEPLAKVMPSVDTILRGPPVMKLLFMTDPAIVDGKLKPDWQVMLQTLAQSVGLLRRTPASCSQVS